MGAISYTLDGYTLTRMPGKGGYSGYNPHRRRADLPTLSDNIGIDWGIVPGDTVITITSPVVTMREWLSLQTRYQAGGTYNWQDGWYTMDVEIVDLQGHPFAQQTTDQDIAIVVDVAMSLKVLSAGSL